MTAVDPVATKTIDVPLHDFVNECDSPVKLGREPRSTVSIVRFADLPKPRQAVLAEMAGWGLWPKRPPIWAARVPQREGEAPRRTMDRLLIALKLLEPEYVNANYLVCDACPEVMLGRDFLPHYFPMGRPTSEAFHLTGGAIAQADTEWDTFFELPQNFAVVRFNIAEHRPYAWDVFADFGFALEYLLAPEERGLAYWCRLGAALVTPKGTDREQLVDRLDAIYDLRSCIVHGDEYMWRDRGAKAHPLKSGDWTAPTVLVRNLVRDFLRLFAIAGCLHETSDRKAFILKAVLDQGLQIGGPRKKRE